VSGDPLRVHGDRIASDGMLDFAVNVWPGPARPSSSAGSLTRSRASAIRTASRRAPPLPPPTDAIRRRSCC